MATIKRGVIGCLLMHLRTGRKVNKYAIFLWGPPKKVVIIENAEIAESFRQQFLAHWKIAKPVGT